jgi:hypothetical protein
VVGPLGVVLDEDPALEGDAPRRRLLAAVAFDDGVELAAKLSVAVALPKGPHFILAHVNRVDAHYRWLRRRIRQRVLHAVDERKLVRHRRRGRMEVAAWMDG